MLRLARSSSSHFMCWRVSEDAVLEAASSRRRSIRALFAREAER